MKSMKFTILILSFILANTLNVYSAEEKNCQNLKKYSIQYTWCKSKNAGKAFKNKIGNLKNKSKKQN